MGSNRIFKSERDVKRDVKKLLDKHGWFWFCPPANSYGRTGIADFIALRDGVAMAIETKYDGNRPTAMQAAFLESFAAESAFGFVVDEVTIFALETWMEAFDRSCTAASKGEKVADEDGAAMLDAMKALSDLTTA